jgi:hypothetical protein
MRGAFYAGSTRVPRVRSGVSPKLRLQIETQTTTPIQHLESTATPAPSLQSSEILNSPVSIPLLKCLL